LKLKDAVVKAYETKWSMVNTFTVQITGGVAGGGYNDSFQINIKDFTSSDFQNDPIEAFTANKWFIHNGKDNLYRFSMTVRDEDQLKYYKEFLKMYGDQKEKYFDDIKMTVTITKDADWISESDKKLLEYSGVMIETVSNLAFSNETENQIAEFTVGFKAVKYEVK